MGEPDKIAALIVELSNRDTLPPHLILGSDALAVYTQAEGVRQTAATEWLEVSKSVDFAGVDLSVLKQAGFGE